MQAFVHSAARAATWLALAVIALLPLATLAADAIPTEQDPVAAARAVRISEQLRCLVCQNQTIADSNAELARDLRREVREQIAAGKSDDDIIAFMTGRYGDFVLYKPPLKPATLLLWGGPALLMALGFFALARTLRRRRAETQGAPLSAQEHEQAQELLTGGTPRNKT